MPVSKDRQAAFAKCATLNKSKRVAYNLDERSFTNRLTNEQVIRLTEYMKDTKLTNVHLLEYRGLERLSNILCRWPRPSEVARLFKINNGVWKLERCTVTMDLPSIAERSKFVGKMGASLTALTKKYNLMYAWLQTDGDTVLLHLYGKDERFVMKDDSRLTHAINDDSVKNKRAPGVPVIAAFKVSTGKWTQGLEMPE